MRTQVYQYTCDAPGCPTMHHIQLAHEEPPGFSGTVTDAADGIKAQWYACESGHIGRAVLAAVERAREEAG
jgi:hypothetical protein